MVCSTSSAHRQSRFGDPAAAQGGLDFFLAGQCFAPACPRSAYRPNAKTLPGPAAGTERASGVRARSARAPPPAPTVPASRKTASGPFRIRPRRASGTTLIKPYGVKFRGQALAAASAKGRYGSGPSSRWGWDGSSLNSLQAFLSLLVSPPCRASPSAFPPLAARPPEPNRPIPTTASLRSAVHPRPPRATRAVLGGAGCSCLTAPSIFPPSTAFPLSRGSKRPLRAVFRPSAGSKRPFWAVFRLLAASSAPPGPRSAAHGPRRLPSVAPRGPAARGRRPARSSFGLSASRVRAVRPTASSPLPLPQSFYVLREKH